MGAGAEPERGDGRDGAVVPGKQEVGGGCPQRGVPHMDGDKLFREAFLIRSFTVLIQKEEAKYNVREALELFFEYADQSEAFQRAV